MRVATPSDALELARLRFAFRATQGIAREPSEEFVARCTEWMRGRLASESVWRCWVLEDGDRIVGHVWVGLVEKIPNPVGEAEHHAYLSNLYVRDQDRGGAGAQLVEAALAWCRTQRVDYVILWPSERSRSLYERYGFGPADGILALKASP